LHFFETRGEEIQNIYCSHIKVPVHTGNCRGHNDRTRCFTVLANTITVNNSFREPERNLVISCEFSIVGYNNETGPVNTNIGWALEGPHGSFDSPYSDALWIEPRDFPGAWVSLRKIHVTPLTNAFYTSSSNDEVVWEKSYLYHTTERNFTNYYFYVDTAISTFRVMHFEQTNSYNGWMAVGGMGGFAFFMVVLHTAVMIIIGFFFSNESRFLLGGGSKAERRPMM